MKSRTEWEGGGEAAQGGQGNPASLRQRLEYMMDLYVKWFFTEVLQWRTDKTITYNL